METFNFNCPQCKNLLSAEDEWRGMETQCPYCEKTITIPLHKKSRTTPKYDISKIKDFLSILIEVEHLMLLLCQLVMPLMQLMTVQ